MSANYIVIMAGGVGSRFWPASREDKPKQFLDMLGLGKSLLRLTYERFLKVTEPDKIYVVTNEKYRSLVKQDIPEMGDHQIMGEPSRNNTAPCVAYASFKIYDLDHNANLVFAPSDHFIAQEEEFVRIINEGLAFVAKGDFLLTLGMKPHRPDTGYGYIELGGKLKNATPIYQVDAFREKPNLDTAKKYLASGSHMWNSGIFLFSVKTILRSFSEHATDIFSILVKGAEEYNTEKEPQFLSEMYPTTPNISIDYAIMEKAKNVYCYPSDFGWTDLGTWGSLYDFKKKDGEDNVVVGSEYQTKNDNGNLIVGPNGKTIVTRGLQDFMVVDNNDVLLICSRDQEEAIKEIRQNQIDSIK